ncbi:hypothetical protein F2P79_022626 [Pimephales promelas]|nr:hypothetical protein F2P79_022626 [Pimephales promelas]
MNCEHQVELPDMQGLGWKDTILICLERFYPRSISSPDPDPSPLPPCDTVRQLEPPTDGVPAVLVEVQSSLSPPYSSAATPSSLGSTVDHQIHDATGIPRPTSFAWVKSRQPITMDLRAVNCTLALHPCGSVQLQPPSGFEKVAPFLTQFSGFPAPPRWVFLGAPLRSVDQCHVDPSTLSSTTFCSSLVTSIITSLISASSGSSLASSLPLIHPLKCLLSFITARGQAFSGVSLS